MPPARRTDTADRILDVAERLVQVHGYNGFSYADVSAAVRIRKASLHYHFPTKAGLGTALIARYRSAFLDALEAIDRGSGDERRKLDAYAGLYAKVLQQGRMCLCGMLAADVETLPRSMRAGVIGFFDANEEWLTEVLAAGRRAGVLAFAGSPRATATFLVSSLEGAMLISRSYGGVARFQGVVKKLLDDLTPATRQRRTLTAC
jgi:TetR/AcrR family transcriptional repressor of nem operon